MFHVPPIRLNPILAAALLSAGLIQAHAAGYQVTDLGRTYLPTTSPCSGCTQTTAFNVVALSDTGVVLEKQSSVVTYPYGGGMSSPPPLLSPLIRRPGKMSRLPSRVAPLSVWPSI